jgi:hypothetical protein
MAGFFCIAEGNRLDKIWRYIQCPLIGKGSLVLPLSRLDLIAGSIATVAAMFAIASAFETQNLSSGERIAVVLIPTACIAVSNHKRSVIGGMFSIFAFRFLLGFCLISRTISMLIAAVLCGLISWILLRGLEAEKMPEN